MRRSLWCFLGLHRWKRVAWLRWECTRCGKQPKRCDNCGGQHDPTAGLIVCIVERGHG